ncbi:uncharacterized protein LOC113789015 [Dermatophagoides pteronyssinus]|uniref:uncharacterized protein LOC113789015 n=1 Tax=Dermatophagoides pteronyssinus TaxID=6956 RepID=UPI003F67EEFE
MRSQTEFSLVIINGLMHHYINEKWIIIGQSRIGIYHDSEANTFRIVGRKLDNYDVVANCSINESFCYNKATTTFHQWRDIIDDKVYGVKFINMNDAQLFGETIDKIVDSSEKIARLTASTNSLIMANKIGDGGGDIDEIEQQQQEQFQQTFNESNNQTSVIDLSKHSTLTRKNIENGENCFHNYQQQQHPPLSISSSCSSSLSSSSSSSSTSSTTNNISNNGNNVNFIEINQYNNNNRTMNDTSLMIKNQTPTYVSVGPNSNQTLSSTVIPPPPPPLPPLVPPHLKIPPKPKISAKPESLSNSMNNTVPPFYHSKMTQSNPNLSNLCNNNNTNNNNNRPPSSNLFGEMAQKLAKRRAKIEENEQSNVDNGTKSSDLPVDQQPKATSPVKCYNPINSTIRRLNSISNGSSVPNQNDNVNGRQNGKSSTLNTNLRMNSQSLINIANGVRTNGHHSRAQSPAPPPLPPSLTVQNTVSNPIGSSSSDRLKEEIMQEFRQELIQFKQDLLNAIRTEIFNTLNGDNQRT